jgi:hypothetical protein
MVAIGLRNMVHQLQREFRYKTYFQCSGTWGIDSLKKAKAFTVVKIVRFMAIQNSSTETKYIEVLIL